jgi:hypothetical protein
MALVAMAIPILPGKTEQVRQFARELSGSRKAEFQASRQKLGAHERSFLQSTPAGDVVIVTLEADDPGAAFARFGEGTDEFTRWFVQQVKELHGFDLTQPPPGPVPELLVDSQAK